jgi:hypothetical protein
MKPVEILCSEKKSFQYPEIFMLLQEFIMLNDSEKCLGILVTGSDHDWQK